MPTVQARKFGSEANRTTRPLPSGSSMTAAVPPSSSTPREKPETKKSPWSAGGYEKAACAGSDGCNTRS